MKPIRPLDFVSILMLIAINLAISLAVLPDYGESWDETRLYEYAGQSLEAYRSLFDNIEVDFGTDDLRYYGPAYLMGASLFVQAVHGAFPQISVIALWHLGNFLCLQFGLLCFYFLLRRFMEILPALSATLLFASQPLIWGHSFINPKDIPFMAFFTASIFFGMMMLEDFERRNYEVKALIRSPWFYAAAILLGLTISIRIVAFARAGVVLGYFVFINAGWAPGQLERKIGEGSWIIIPPDPALVFETPLPQVWEKALRDNGIDPAAIVPGTSEEA